MKYYVQKTRPITIDEVAHTNILLMKDVESLSKRVDELFEIVSSLKDIIEEQMKFYDMRLLKTELGAKKGKTFTPSKVNIIMEEG